MTSNLRVVRFINNKTPCHYIVKSLLSCSKSNHKKSYAEDKPGKYLPKVATRCLSERYTLARQISNYYSKSHFAESRLFRRTFHDCLINPNKQKTQVVFSVSIGLKNFLPPKLKHGSSRCFCAQGESRAHGAIKDIGFTDRSRPLRDYLRKKNSRADGRD